MATRKLPSPELLRQLLDYDPTTGILIWKPRPLEMFPDARSWKIWNTRFAGREAMTATNGRGYLKGSIFYQTLKAHRVIWAMETGKWPDQIDHINGVRHENWWDNLRDVSGKENQRNLTQPNTNTSGVVGVYLDKRRGRWNARIGREAIGSFSSFQDAVEARMAAEVSHNYHANHARRRPQNAMRDCG